MSLFMQAQADRAQLMAELVGQVLGPMIGAALAAYLAITWGVSQFRDQRAFDRRLDWYEQTSRALTDFQGIIKELLVLLQLRGPEVVPALEKLAAKLGELSLHLQYIDLYASSASIPSVLELRRRLEGQQHRLGGDVGGASREETLLLLRQVLEEWQPLVTDARYALTGELREHLGLGAFPNGASKPTFREWVARKLPWEVSVASRPAPSAPSGAGN